MANQLRGGLSVSGSILTPRIPFSALSRRLSSSDAVSPMDVVSPALSMPRMSPGWARSPTAGARVSSRSRSSSRSISALRARSRASSRSNAVRSIQDAVPIAIHVGLRVYGRDETVIVAIGEGAGAGPQVVTLMPDHPLVLGRARAGSSAAHLPLAPGGSGGCARNDRARPGGGIPPGRRGVVVGGVARVDRGGPRDAARAPHALVIAAGAPRP